MANLTLVQAVNDALKTAMRADPSVVVFGEDVGPKGGVFLATEGLTKEFGANRCFDTPLSEDGIVGTAIGMAVNGLRPVAEIQFQDFIFPAFDQIVSEAAKLRYRSGGQYSAPMVIRTPYGGGIRGGLYHSQSGEAYFCHTPGLKVVIPSTPADAKGLLLASIDDPDPVIFLEPKALYRSTKGEVPDGKYTVPLSTLRVVREGKNVTVFCYGAMVPVCAKAAEQAAAKGIECAIVDLRTLLPLDEDGVLDGGRKNRRFERFDLKLAPRGVLVARLASNTELLVEARAGGARLGAVALSPETFREVELSVPATLDASRPVTVELEALDPKDGLFTALHYWSYRPEP